MDLTCVMCSWLVFSSSKSENICRIYRYDSWPVTLLLIRVMNCSKGTCPWPSASMSHRYW